MHLPPSPLVSWKEAVQQLRRERLQVLPGRARGSPVHGAPGPHPRPLRRTSHRRRPRTASRDQFSASPRQPAPPRSNSAPPGRVHVVQDGTAHRTHALLLTDAEAADWLTATAAGEICPRVAHSGGSAMTSPGPGSGVTPFSDGEPHQYVWSNDHGRFVDESSWGCDRFVQVQGSATRPGAVVAGQCITAAQPCYGQGVRCQTCLVTSSHAHAEQFRRVRQRRHPLRSCDV